jgi:hypothetical protein
VDGGEHGRGDGALAGDAEFGDFAPVRQGTQGTFGLATGEASVQASGPPGLHRSVGRLGWGRRVKQPRTVPSSLKQDWLLC